MKIPASKYFTFCTDFYSYRFKHLRFGQAFLNEFLPDVSDSELFYMENAPAAQRLIEEKYVDFEG